MILSTCLFRIVETEELRQDFKSFGESTCIDRGTVGIEILKHGKVRGFTVIQSVVGFYIDGRIGGIGGILAVDQIVNGNNI